MSSWISNVHKQNIVQHKIYRIYYSTIFGCKQSWQLGWVGKHIFTYSVQIFNTYKWTLKGKTSWPNESGMSWQPEFYLQCYPCSRKSQVGRVGKHLLFDIYTEWTFKGMFGVDKSNHYLSRYPYKVKVLLVESFIFPFHWYYDCKCIYCFPGI